MNHLVKIPTELGREGALQIAKFWLLSVVRKRIRTIEEFAEEEVMLPRDGGKFGGQPFRVERQPFVRLLWNEMQSALG